eukprot:TRINITY_DN24535_c0_g1_i1.p1 TRINITY_DN24535_c0_g1~~TRINITY_DN24535_c0_g1_i1.p1  ORF type:complete len:2940 (+),score=571.46 TRINITY_DN24535_c0_g1_i1:521-8821(+)
MADTAVMQLTGVVSVLDKPELQKRLQDICKHFQAIGQDLVQFQQRLQKMHAQKKQTTLSDIEEEMKSAQSTESRASVQVKLGNLAVCCKDWLAEVTAVDLRSIMSDNKKSKTRGVQLQKLQTETGIAQRNAEESAKALRESETEFENLAKEQAIITGLTSGYPRLLEATDARQKAERELRTMKNQKNQLCVQAQLQAVEEESLQKLVRQKERHAEEAEARVAAHRESTEVQHKYEQLDEQAKALMPAAAETIAQNAVLENSPVSEQRRTSSRISLANLRTQDPAKVSVPAGASSGEPQVDEQADSLGNPEPADASNQDKRLRSRHAIFVAMQARQARAAQDQAAEEAQEQLKSEAASVITNALSAATAGMSSLPSGKRSKDVDAVREKRAREKAAKVLADNNKLTALLKDALLKKTVVQKRLERKKQVLAKVGDAVARKFLSTSTTESQTKSDTAEGWVKTIKNLERSYQNRLEEVVSWEERFRKWHEEVLTRYGESVLSELLALNLDDETSRDLEPLRNALLKDAEATLPGAEQSAYHGPKLDSARHDERRVLVDEEGSKRSSPIPEGLSRTLREVQQDRKKIRSRAIKASDGKIKNSNEPIADESKRLSLGLLGPTPSKDTSSSDARHRAVTASDIEQRTNETSNFQQSSPVMPDLGVYASKRSSLFQRLQLSKARTQTKRITSLKPEDLGPLSLGLVVTASGAESVAQARVVGEQERVTSEHTFSNKHADPLSSKVQLENSSNVFMFESNGPSGMVAPLVRRRMRSGKQRQLDGEAGDATASIRGGLLFMPGGEMESPDRRRNIPNRVSNKSKPARNFPTLAPWHSETREKEDMHSKRKTVIARSSENIWTGLVWQDDEERALWNDTDDNQLILKKLRLCKQKLVQHFGGVDMTFLKCVPALSDLTHEIFVDIAHMLGFTEGEATDMFMLVLDVKHQLPRKYSVSTRFKIITQGRTRLAGNDNAVSKVEFEAVLRRTAPVHSLTQLKKRLKLRYRSMEAVLDAVFGHAQHSLDKVGFRDSMLRLGILGPEAGWLFYQIANNNNLKVGSHPSSSHGNLKITSEPESLCLNGESAQNQQGGNLEADLGIRAAAEGGAISTSEGDDAGSQCVKDATENDGLIQVTRAAFQVSVIRAGGLDAARLLKAELASTISENGGLKHFVLWIRGRRNAIYAGDHVVNKFRQTLGLTPDPSTDSIPSNKDISASMSSGTAEQLSKQPPVIFLRGALESAQASSISESSKVQKRHDAYMQAVRRLSNGAAYLAREVGKKDIAGSRRDSLIGAGGSRRNSLSLADHGIAHGSLMVGGQQCSRFPAHDLLRGSPMVQRMILVTPSQRTSSSAGSTSSAESDADSDSEFEHCCPDASLGKRMTSKLAKEAEEKWTKAMLGTFNQLVLGPEVSPFQPMSRTDFIDSVQRLRQVSADGARALLSLCAGPRPRENAIVAPVDILLRAFGGFGQKYEILKSHLGLDQSIHTLSEGRTGEDDGSGHSKTPPPQLALEFGRRGTRRGPSKGRVMLSKGRLEKSGFVPLALDADMQLEFVGMSGARQRADTGKPGERSRIKQQQFGSEVNRFERSDELLQPISKSEAAEARHREQEDARDASASHQKQQDAWRHVSGTAVYAQKMRKLAKKQSSAKSTNNQGITSGEEGGSEGQGGAKGMASWQEADSPLTTDIEQSVVQSSFATTTGKSLSESLNALIGRKINKITNGKKLKHGASTNFNLRDEVLSTSPIRSRPTSPKFWRGQPSSKINTRLADLSSAADASQQNLSDMRIDAGMLAQSTPSSPTGKEDTSLDEKMKLSFGVKIFPVQDGVVETRFAVASDAERMLLKSQAEAELYRVRDRLNLFDGNKTELDIALKIWQNTCNALLSSKVVKGVPQRAFQRLTGSSAAKLPLTALQDCLVKVLKLTTLDALRAATVSTCVEGVTMLGCPEFLQAYRFCQPVRNLLDLRMRFVQRFGTAAAGIDALASLGLGGRKGMDDFSVDQLDRLMLGCGICLSDASHVFEEVDALNLNKLSGFITIQHLRFAIDSAQVIRWLQIFQQRLGGHAAANDAISEAMEEKQIGLLGSEETLLKLLEPLGFPEEFIAPTFGMLTERLRVMSSDDRTLPAVSVQHLQTILGRLPDEPATNMYAKAVGEPSQGLKAYRSMEDPLREEAALESEQEFRKILASKYNKFSDVYIEFSPQDPEEGLSLDEWEKKRDFFKFPDPERWAHIFGHMLEWQHPRWDKKCRIETRVNLPTLVKFLNDSLPMHTLQALRQRFQSLFSTPMKIWTAVAGHDRAEEVSLAQWRYSLLAMGVRCSDAVHLWSLIMVSPVSSLSSFEGGALEQRSLSKATFMAIMKSHAVEASAKLQELITNQPVSTLFETCPYPRHALQPDAFSKAVIPILRHSRAVAQRSWLPEKTLLEDAKMLFLYLDVQREGVVPVDDLLRSMTALQACYMPAYSVPLRRKKSTKSRWKVVSKISSMFKLMGSPTPDGMRDTTSTFAPTESDAERPLTRDGSQDAFDVRPGTSPSHVRSFLRGAQNFRPMTVPAEQQGSVTCSLTSFLRAPQEWQWQESGSSMDSGKEQPKPPESPRSQGRHSIFHAGSQAGQAAAMKAAARFKQLPRLAEKTQTGLPASQLQAVGSQDQSSFSPDLPDPGVKIQSSVAAPRGSMLHGSGGNGRALFLQALSKQSTSSQEQTAKSNVDSALVPGEPAHLPKAETAMRKVVKPPGPAGHSTASPRKKSIYRNTAALTAMEAEVGLDAGSSFFEVKKIDARQLGKD